MASSRVINYSYYFTITNDVVKGKDSVLTYSFSSEKEYQKGEGKLTSCKYYKNGLLIKESEQSLTGKFAQELYLYDSLSRLSKVLFINSSGLKTSSLTYSYYGDSVIVAIFPTDSVLFEGKFYLEHSNHRIVKEAYFRNHICVNGVTYSYSDGNKISRIIRRKLSLKQGENDTPIWSYELIDSASNTRFVQYYDGEGILSSSSVVSCDSSWRPITAKFLYNDTNGNLDDIEIIKYSYLNKIDDKKYFSLMLSFYVHSSHKEIYIEKTVFY